MPFPLEEPFGEDWETVKRNFRKLAGGMNPPVSQARVYNGADLPLANNTTTTLTFNAERYDSGDLHSTAALTSRLTVPITGLYSIGACVAYASNATGYRQTFVLLNGTTTIVDDLRAPVSGVATVVNIATDYRLAAGDYVEVQAFQNSGGALNVVALPNFSPDFWMHRVGGYVNQGV